jgi:4-hydroxyphenylpyruvate dioxygenase
MAARGFQPLPMTATYYAGLAARFGLPGDEVERLAAHHILNDYDEDGRAGGSGRSAAAASPPA